MDEILDSTTEAGDAVDADLKLLAEEVQRLNEERDSIRDQLLRTMADFQNFRKRQDEQRSAERERQLFEVMVDFLPILDNYDRALASITNGASAESVMEGLGAIRKQMSSLLASRGIERLEVLGVPFDPEQHDALGVVASTEAEEGTVVEEIQAGYKIGKRIMRPAKVRVAGSV